MIRIFALILGVLDIIDIENKIFTKTWGLEYYDDNISCHHTKIVDDIPPMNDKITMLLDNPIFFIDSSCNGGLNYRQACSVEAAARAHPYRQIYLFFAGPVRISNLLNSPLDELAKYNNINIFRLFVSTFLKYTPLYSLWVSGVWNSSYYPIHHTGDILRYATLYKYGGVYLDLDTVVAKPLDLLPEPTNWAGKEDMDHVGVGLLALSKDGIGGQITYEILRALKNNFGDDASKYHSVTLLTESLQKFCETTNVSSMTVDQCKGFQVYDSWYFYSIPRQFWKTFFTQYEKEGLKEEFAFHIWNKIAKDESIYHDSLYAQIMKRHCPRIYKSMSANNKIRPRPTTPLPKGIFSIIPETIKNINPINFAKQRIRVKM